MTTPAWLQACAAEADKGFDPHVLSYHMGWVAAMSSENAEIFAIRQSVFDLVTERDAVKAELACLRNQGAELFAAQQLAFTLNAELEALRNQKPVAWFNAKMDMTTIGHYNDDDVPLYLAAGAKDTP